MWSYDSASQPSPLPPPPFSSASCLSFSVFQYVACRAYMKEGGTGRGRSQIIRRRESLVLYKSFNTLWSIALAGGKQYIRKYSVHSMSQENPFFKRDLKFYQVPKRISAYQFTIILCTCIILIGCNLQQLQKFMQYTYICR